jgi:predicted site-specific integrase-resolvase
MSKYTTKQFADLVGVSSSILRRLHKQGHFNAFQVPGGRSIYTDDHVEEFKKRFFNAENIISAHAMNNPTPI